MRPSTLAPRSGFALLCAALGWLGPATDVRAELLINVDFNAGSPTYSGAGVLGASGDVWNGIGGPSGPSNVPLVDSANAATGVTLSHRLFGFSDAAGSAIFAGTPYDALLSDYLVADVQGESGPGIVSFGGLTPGGTYRLILYSVANAVGRGTVFTVSGVDQVVQPSGEAILSQGDNYADFTTRADAQGTLTIAAGSSDEADLNGIQLQEVLDAAAVPEPSTLANGLLGVALLGGWWLRRRGQP